jgi:alpha-tubulin suppressor-like RCC1 family protein
MRLTVGSEHSLGLNDDGTVYAWGTNDAGQTGGTRREQLNPNNVPLPDDKKANSVSCRGKTSMALATDGSLYVWGGNENSLVGGKFLILLCFDQKRTQR